MNEVSFTTSQNVVIDYEIASLGDRIIGHVVDWLIKIGYALIFVFFGSKLDGFDVFFTWFLIILVIFIPIVFYSLIFELAMQGQTPGKRIRSIRVVKLDGTQASLGAYVLRWLFRLVDFTIFFGVISIVVYLVNGRGQRLGDILAKTCVIRTKNRVMLKDTIFERLNSDHVITFPEVYKLTEKDIEIIKKVLSSDMYRDNFEMIVSLSQNIENKMGIKRVMAIEEFLEIVVKDYNYYAGQ